MVLWKRGRFYHCTGTSVLGIDVYIYTRMNYETQNTKSNSLVFTSSYGCLTPAVELIFKIITPDEP